MYNTTGQFSARLADRIQTLSTLSTTARVRHRAELTLNEFEDISLVSVVPVFATENIVLM